MSNIQRYCRSAEDTVDRANFLEDLAVVSAPLARAFVTPQRYENLTCPRSALMKGTIFDSLYMPVSDNQCSATGGSRYGTML